MVRAVEVPCPMHGQLWCVPYLLLDCCQGCVGFMQLGIGGGELLPLGFNLRDDIVVQHDIDGPLAQTSSGPAFVEDDLLVEVRQLKVAAAGLHSLLGDLSADMHAVPNAC